MGSCVVPDAGLCWPDWPAVLDEAVLDAGAPGGVWVVDGVMPAATLQALVQHLRDQPLQAARLTGARVQQNIRSDAIDWFDAQQPLEATYLASLQALGAWLNRQFFLGIRRVEAHHAVYAPGAFYALHRDNPAGRSERAISGVFYLNDAWQASDGGQLRVQDAQGQWREWLPLGNRLVLFDSNLLHEVRPAKRTRCSIASWLRRDAI